MKILFVSAGDASGNPKPVVYAQGESLRKEGVDVTYFCIIGRGLAGYLSAVPRLKRKIREFNPDIVHAHYSLCGFVSTLAGVRKPIVSLMGSDVNGTLIARFISRLFAKHWWKLTLVKSEQMKQRLAIDGVIVLPNGVDLSLFREQDVAISRKVTRLTPEKTVILFPGNPERKEKNWPLASAVMEVLNRSDVILIPLHGKRRDELPYWYSAARALLSVSLWEGSPNMIKEALACNLPVVATPAGDIPWLLDGVKNCTITDYNATVLAAELSDILSRGERSDGRNRIIELGLDSVAVSTRLAELYVEHSS
jgi:teichuronic acid biosynthesis glycosyltransferase TuaC